MGRLSLLSGAETVRLSKHEGIMRNSPTSTPDNKLKILLVYPEYPDTFWSFKHALKFISKKAPLPPLGLLTVAAMLPEEWDVRLVDMNVQALHDNDILRADYVFLSAMSVQRKSVDAVVERCRKHGKKIVAGGSLFTASPEEFGQVDHLVLNEAEVTLPSLLEDMKMGRARHIYTSSGWADLDQDTDSPMGTHQHEILCLDECPVLARLSL